jgi:hypothetical protein
MAAKKIKTTSTMLTRNGKTRLGPLNITQLEKLLSNARKKHVAMIQRRIAFLKTLPSYRAPAVAIAEEAVAE